MSRLFVKRIAIVIPVLMALLALAFPTPNGVFAQIQDPKTVRDGIDAKLDSVIANIIGWQAGEASKSGKFYQVLWTHSQAPADGALVLPDLLYSSPTDQIGKSAQAQWDAAKLPASFYSRIRVDL